MTTEPVVPVIQFLRHPVLRAVPAARLTLWRWIGWLCLLLVVAMAAGVIVDGALAHAFGWHVPAGTFLKYMATHFSVAAVLILLFAPIVEEVGFRAFLSTDPKAVFVGLAFFLGYVYGLVQGSQRHVTGAFAVAHYYSHLWVLIPAGVVSLLLYFYARTPVMQFFKQHGAWVFWVSCAVFGAMHAFDFTNGGLAWWDFVLVLPQFCLGVGLAYLRVTYGLRWSMLTHWVYDSLLMLMVWGRLMSATDYVAKATFAASGLVLLLFVLVYGIVAATRVARGRW